MARIDGVSDKPTLPQPEGSDRQVYWAEGDPFAANARGGVVYVRREAKLAIVARTEDTPTAEEMARILTLAYRQGMQDGHDAEHALHSHTVARVAWNQHRATYHRAPREQEE